MKTDPNLKSLLTYLLVTTRTMPLSTFVTDMDRKILRRRAIGEGIPFLCVLLPTLGKAVEAALEEGVWNTPAGFKTPSDDRRPCLLHEAFSAIFNRDGTLIERADVKLVADAVLTIRQVTLFAGKCDFGSINAAQIDSCWSSFKDNQDRLRNHDLQSQKDKEVVKGVPFKAVMHRARDYINRLCSTFTPDDLVPRHGPGADAGGVVPVKRYDVAKFQYNELLDRLFGYADYCFAGPNHLAYDWETLKRLPKAEVFFDKATFVTKTYEQCRGISKIPLTPMYFGQAIQCWLRDRFKSHNYRLELDITDQARNQILAKAGSRPGGREATIDMKDASDSLKKELVWYCTAQTPIFDYLFAVRSQGTSFRGEYVEYACYAPMGSPVCFPVQTMVFWAIAKAAAYCALGRESRVSVYGDDIICDKRAYGAVTTALELAGLRVNHRKSFYRGLFRESCGADYYGGYDVSIVRAKQVPQPPSYSDDDVEKTLLRHCDLYNRFINGYKVSQIRDPELLDKIRGLTKGLLGCNIPEIPADLFDEGGKTDITFYRSGRVAVKRDSACVDKPRADALSPTIAALIVPDGDRVRMHGFDLSLCYTVQRLKKFEQRRVVPVLSVKPRTRVVVPAYGYGKVKGKSQDEPLYVRNGWCLILKDLAERGIKSEEQSSLTGHCYMSTAEDSHLQAGIGEHRYAERNDNVPTIVYVPIGTYPLSTDQGAGQDSTADELAIR